MLVLARRETQAITIDHPAGAITVKVLVVNGKYVSIGIDAPQDVRVARDDIKNTERVA